LELGNFQESVLTIELGSSLGREGRRGGLQIAQEKDREGYKGPTERGEEMEAGRGGWKKRENTTERKRELRFGNVL